jgi:hypothetical protein
LALGDPVIVKDRVSPSRFNAKTYHWSDATTLHNMATTPCMIVIPTTTGFEFTKDQPKIRSADNDAWLNLGMNVHTHDGPTDNQGGDFSNVLMDNIGRHYSIDRMALNATSFAQKVGGTGSTVTDDLLLGSRSRVLLTAGTTTNAYAHIMLYGVELDWGHPSRFIQICEFSHDTTILARAGMGAEDVHIANTINKKYGTEVCDNAVEGKFYLLFSSDGVSRTTSGSTTAILPGSPKGAHIIHQPSLNVKLTLDGVETIPPMVVKGSNIPSSGGYTADATDTQAVYKSGVLAKAASASRSMRVAGMKYVGLPNSVRWFQSPPEG